MHGVMRWKEYTTWFAFKKIPQVTNNEQSRDTNLEAIAIGEMVVAQEKTDVQGNGEKRMDLRNSRVKINRTGNGGDELGVAGTGGAVRERKESGMPPRCVA